MNPTAKRLRELFVIKPDGSLLWLHAPKNHPDLQGRPAGSEAQGHSGKSYCLVQVDGRKYRRSQIVFCMTTGEWPEHQIDHINGNSLDDRPRNLRSATAIQNAWNHKKRAKASPLPMGVRVAKSGRYVARIAVNKRQITIGTYDDSEQASRAYQSARIQHFGEFA